MTPEAIIMESMFRIPNKQGVDMNFILNDAQRLLDNELTGRDIIPKARQEGISSYFLGRYLAACMSRRNTRAVVISHDLESTQRMLSRVQYFIKNVRGPKPVVKNMSKNEITFPKTDSMFYLGTAGSRSFGRGDTITHLHCSEYAFWPNPQKLMTGLLQAVPMSGEVAIESTGNGFNDYSTRCMRAAKGQSTYKLHFFSWHTFPEYRVELSDEEAAEFMDSLDPSLKEVELADFLGAERLAWRRIKLEELDYNLDEFEQEYPMSLDECFKATGHSIFYRVLYSPTDNWKQVDSTMWLLEGHPSKNKRYVIGADVSAGVRQDSSVAQVICLEDMEQVGSYISNAVQPDVFGEKLISLGETFNNAYLIVENNNHGIVTLAEIDKGYPPHLVHTTEASQASGIEDGLHKLGFRTTSRTKPLMIGKLRRLLASTLVVHCPILHAELNTFIEHPDGSMGAQDGCHDDAVMALACAGMGLEHGDLATEEAVETEEQRTDPLSIDGIIKELHGRKGSYPIPFQHQGSWL